MYYYRYYNNSVLLCITTGIIISTPYSVKHITVCQLTLPKAQGRGEMRPPSPGLTPMHAKT